MKPVSGGDAGAPGDCRVFRVRHIFLPVLELREHDSPDIVKSPARLHIDAFDEIVVDERPWLQKHLARRTVENVVEAVSRRVDESLSHTPSDLEVHDDARTGLVEIPGILWRQVVGPYEFAAVGVARQYRRAVIVAVARQTAPRVEIDLAPLPPVIRVPGRAIAGAVVEQIQIRVEGEPSPDRAAATFPGVSVPGVERRIGNFIVGVERFETRADADFVVRPHTVVSPSHAAGIDVVGGDVAPYALFSAHHADDDFVVDDERHCAGRFTYSDVGVFSAPNDFPVLGVEREDLSVQRAVENLAVGVGQSARFRTAACRLDCRIDLQDFGPEFPFDGAVASEIEGVDVIRLRRDDVHRIADHERRGFMRVENSELHAPRHRQVLDVREVDLIETAVIPTGIVAVGHDPLFRILL